jgi:LacI family gluconate utilization system Gnt-I transcriptional repressor
MLVEARIPIVEIWDVSARPIDMVIGFDHARVGADVAAFFRQKGHRRFATLMASDSRALTRGRGFTEEAVRLGGAVVSEQVLPAPSTIAAGREGLRKLLPQINERLALFCSSDLLAFGVVTEARMQGIDMPDRLAVCGFGNFELSEMNEPSITTVNVEGVQTGRNAASVLLRRLAGEQSHQPEQVEVPFRIIERAST